MSIMAIKGVPPKWSMKTLNVAILNGAKCLRGKLEMLNFDKVRGDSKTAYFRVSEKLDPLRVVAMINRLSFKNAKLVAYIPTHVPDFPLPFTGNLTTKLMATGRTTEWVLESTHKVLLEELQRKYRGLSNLSKKTDHKLLDEIAETLLQRLKCLMQTDTKGLNHSMALSKAYRTAHPHFADFQLILSTLHRIEDAAGAPRTQILEHALLASPEPYDPFAEVHKTATAYFNKIVARVRAETEALVVEGEAESPEHTARRRVRTELKNLRPHIATMMKQVLSTVLKRDMPSLCYHRMVMYGAPGLPDRAEYRGRAALLRTRHNLPLRRARAHDAVWLRAPLTDYHEYMKLDGVEVAGCKLTIRPCVELEYKVKPELLTKMSLAYTEDEPTTQDFNFEDGEDWGADIEI